uniref:Uncharacterized protein n=1 Tax=Dromaius novaehollandiae TaxID=8790 RepID=A0A8C4KP07_DRONO
MVAWTQRTLSPEHSRETPLPSLPGKQQLPSSSAKQRRGGTACARENNQDRGAQTPVSRLLPLCPLSNSSLEAGASSTPQGQQVTTSPPMQMPLIQLRGPKHPCPGPPQGSLLLGSQVQWLAHTQSRHPANQDRV